MKSVLSRSPQERQKILEHEDDPEYSDTNYYTPEGELRQKVTETDLLRAGVTKRFIETRKQKRMPEKYVEFFQEWMGTWKHLAKPIRPLKGFYFTGKDLDQVEDLVFTLVGSVINRCWTTYCISASHLVKYCKEEDGTKHLTDVSLLTIVDFGHQYRDKEGYCDSFFIEILDERLHQGKPTFFVSAYSLDELKHYFSSFSGTNLTQIIDRSAQEFCMEG